MRVEKRWLINFMLDVPRPIKRKLINLGLPVAGLEFEVDKNEVIFDETLRITRDMRFFWKNREVSQKVFVNVAVLKTYYYEHIIDVISRLFNLEHVRVYGDAISIGNYTIENLSDAGISAYARVYDDIKIVNGYLSRKIPGVVKITRDPDTMRMIFNFGKLGVEAVVNIDDDYYDEVNLMYRGVYFAEANDSDLNAMIYNDVPIEELIKEARALVNAVTVQKIDDEFRLYRLPSGESIFTDDSMFIVTRDYDVFEEKKMKARYDLLNSGWKYAYWNRTSWYYKKKFGPYNFIKDSLGQRIVFRNGTEYWGELGILEHTNDIWNYLRTLVFV